MAFLRETSLLVMILADSIFDSLGSIGMWGCIAILAMCGAACEIAKMYMRHKERLAKIYA